MKKNKIFGLLAAVALMVSVPSCTDLDERIYDQLPAENFGSTETEINALVGTCYNTLKRVFPSDGLTMSESAGSVQIYPTRKGGDWWDGGQYLQMFMHTYTSMTSCNRGAWNACMESIGTCNANLSTVEGSEMANKDQMAAEIRGIRAYWYYYLINGWGNIPMVTDYSNKELPTNSTRAEAYNWLVNEVNSLIPALPDGTVANYGKFTKASAYALLAKAYLNSESWGLGDKYAQAAEAAGHVINDFPELGLVDNWRDQFLWENSGNKETILCAQYSSNDTSNTNSLHFRTLGYVENLAIGASFGAWNGFCAQPDYVKLFMHDPSKASDPTYTYYDDPENDPRIISFRLGQQYNIKTGDVLMTGHSLPMNHYAEVFPLYGAQRDGTIWADVQQQDGGRVNKWAYDASLTSAMNNDFAIFRMADFYLVRAEALLRSGGSVAEATQLVNAVRSRAWGDDSHNYETVTLADVQLERRLELAWEGVSREDDIRFGCYDKDMWSMLRADVSATVDEWGIPTSYTINPSAWNRPSDDHLKLFPIPLTAWQTNPNLVQNPGYPAFN